MLSRTIRWTRKRKRMTQVDLARRARISQPFVVALEAGTRNPSLTVLRRLAKAFGVPVTELLK